jgi:hypothetical protein
MIVLYTLIRSALITWVLSCPDMEIKDASGDVALETLHSSMGLLWGSWGVASDDIFCSGGIAGNLISLHHIPLTDYSRSSNLFRERCHM